MLRSPQCVPCSAMLLLLISVLDVIFNPRGTGAQSVTQPVAHITVSEGSPLELRCNYSYSRTPYLYWYVQYPSQGLQLLLQYFSGDTLVQGIRDFEAEFRKTETSFHLRKPSAHGSDAAKYFCAVSDTVSGTAGGAEHKSPETLGLFVTQELRRVFQALFFSEGGTRGDTVTEGPVTLPEGTPLTLNCTYERSCSVSVFWYGQHQNKEPELPLKSSSENQRAERHGFQAHHNSDKSFPLEKRGAQTSDWALYYCPLGAQ
ncbi:uncharacterized protein LOC130542291 [Ursus arctos]|uniref:uncharacterized protein LOC130542291 n=1 Tax=Ursus arctos TaxID=9644 RepID=UPI002547D558|nr:uncharacterized protein LOC130542291 [Ursus arctos]